MDIREDETLDDLQLQGMQLIQKKQGFRLCLDSVLLADFAAIRTDDVVADLGTGSGVLPLLLRGRNKGKFYYGIEIQPELAELAERNAKLNHLEQKIRVFCCDAAQAVSFIPMQSVDAVICNPPYPLMKRAESPASKDVSRYQTVDTLHSFLDSAGRLLKGRGRLSVVYPASEIMEILFSLRSHHLEPKRLRMVYPFGDRPAQMVLIEAVKGGKPGLRHMPPLIVYNPDRSLTNELKSIYHISE